MGLEKCEKGRGNIGREGEWMEARYVEGRRVKGSWKENFLELK